MSHRLGYAGWILGVIAAGLLLRSSMLDVSPWLKKYGGVALWAMMIYAIIRCIRPRTKLCFSALLAFAICVSVELGQLYHAPWIDSIRATRLGALALGSVFNWPDLSAYAVGIIFGTSIDAVLQTRTKAR
jgi:hypothetical protein